MKVNHHCGLAAGIRTIASLALTVSATGVVSCYAARPNLASVPNPVSREVLPLDENAARYSNLYDAIEHLRPEYLRVRQDGPTTLTPVAYLNGVRLADLTMLRHVLVSGASEVRWVRPNMTSALYGSRHQLGGGIFVRTK